MPSPLSMDVPEPAGSEAEREAATVVHSSRVEELIVEWLCEPVLKYIPASVHPNTVSLITHAMAWLTTAVAVASVPLPPERRSMALMCAGVGMLLCMIGDCLDGMHARNTNQCTKLGEMMDHWLDAMVVPLVPVGITLALEMPAWGIAAINVGAVMVYQAQLLLYHHTRKFIHPEPASGAAAQLGVSISYFALAILFYFVERANPWMSRGIVAITMVGIYIQARCNLFYYVRLRGLMSRHLIFVGMCAGFATLFLVGAMNRYAFVLTVVFVSFRITGTYVLFTIVGKRYHGNDWGVWACLAAMFLAHTVCPIVQLGPITLQGVLPYLTCLYMIGRNLADFSQHYSQLKPSLRPLAQP